MPQPAPTQSSEIRRLLHSSLAQLSCGFLVAGPDRRVTFANQAFVELTGYSLEEMQGKSCAILQGPKTDPATKEKLRSVLASEGVFDGEILNYRKDGTPFWNALFIAPLRDDAGRLDGFFGIQRDVTTRRQAELALADSHATLQLLIDSVPAYISFIDTDERYRLVNRRYEEYFRRPAAELIGRQVPEVQPAAAYAEMEPHIRAALDGRAARYRGHFHPPGGEARWFDVQYVPRMSEDGTVTGFFVVVFDITDSKSAEASLRESENRFRKLIEFAPEAVVIFDPARGAFVQANPAAERLFKTSAAELTRCGPVEISPPLQPDGQLSSAKGPELVARAMAGETPVCEWMHRDGEGNDILCEVRLLRIELGGRAVIRGSVTDITARKRLEHEREQYFKFFLLSSEPMCIADPFGCFERVNPAFMRLTGYTEKELVSNPYLDFIVPEDRQRTVEEMKLQVSVRPSMHFENRYVCKDGAVILLSWTAIYDKTDGVTYATARDITKLRQTETALHEALESLRKIASQVPGMIYQYHLRPDGTSCFPYASDAILEIYRVTPEEVRTDASKVFAVLHPEDIPSVVASIHESARTLSPWRHEYRVKFADGTVSWRFGNALPQRLPDGSTVWHGFITDITERRQAQIEREQLDRKMLETQKLESLGVLAGGIAHDFNNLLTSILGNASIATLELPVGSPVHESIDQITEASMRAADLCKQMLAYSGRGRFVVQKLELGPLVEQTAQMLQISISKKAILRFHLEKELPLVEVDATQIRQVIMNLVINASEAIADRSGVISIATGLTRIEQADAARMLSEPDLPGGDYVFLEVSDTGCGMSVETREKIFDPFFTTKFTGRGLGLAAVLGIVRGHRGGLKVYSEIGRGTTFKVLLPAVAGGGEAAESPSAPPLAWYGRGTVLVVDDEVTMRSTIARMMRKLGLDVILAGDGSEAVEIFKAQPDTFGVVLLDLTMPIMDGEQAFAELRRLRPEIRVILMSGFNSQEALLRFSGKGLSSFLQKPFTIDALRTVLQSVMG